MTTRFQVRRDTQAHWDQTDPELLEGELAWAVDTNVLKIGFGRWSLARQLFPPHPSRDDAFLQLVTDRKNDIENHTPISKAYEAVSQSFHDYRELIDIFAHPDSKVSADEKIRLLKNFHDTGWIRACRDWDVLTHNSMQMHDFHYKVQTRYYVP